MELPLVFAFFACSSTKWHSSSSSDMSLGCWICSSKWSLVYAFNRPSQIASNRPFSWTRNASSLHLATNCATTSPEIFDTPTEWNRNCCSMAAITSYENFRLGIAISSSSNWPARSESLGFFVEMAFKSLASGANSDW